MYGQSGRYTWGKVSDTSIDPIWEFNGVYRSYLLSVSIIDEH